MDPLAQALQMLQKAGDIISLLVEELSQKRGEKKEDMQKTASENNIASLFALTPSELPTFAKFASLEDAMLIRTSIEREMSFGTLGKVAEISDGTNFNDPAETLNARLAEILGN